jgi:hypothetical protein
MIGGTINPVTITDSSVRYCTPFIADFEPCFVNSFEENDFRYLCSLPHGIVGKGSFHVGTMVQMVMARVHNSFKTASRKCVRKVP